MSLSVLSRVLESAPEFQRLRVLVNENGARTRLQVLPSGIPLALASIAKGTNTPILVVTAQPEESRKLYGQVSLWSDSPESILHFPESDTLPFERLVTDPETEQERIRVLGRLASKSSEYAREAGSNLIITSISGITQETIGREVFDNNCHTIISGEQIELEDILDLWRRMGYKYEPTVQVPGTVSRRGGIIDIYPIGTEAPKRIELWGDEIDSIRLFDPETQRSTETVNSFEVIPAQETLPGLTHYDHIDHLVREIDRSNCSPFETERINSELNLLLDGSEVEDPHFYAGFFNHGSLLDYLPEDTIIVEIDGTDISKVAKEMEYRIDELRKAKEQRGELPFRFPSPYLNWQTTQDKIADFKGRVEVSSWGSEGISHRQTVALPFMSLPDFYGNFENLVLESEEATENGNRVIVVSSLPKRVKEILDQKGVSALINETLDAVPAIGSTTVVSNSGTGLSEGFTLTLNGRKLVVLSDAEVFGVAKQRATSRRRARRRDALLSELNPGDYVVHVEHGIGKFIGTGEASGNQADREYLIIQYAASDELYVPMDHLDRVTPYVAPMGRSPTLTRLGTQEWKKTKARVEQSTKEMATELLSLYASRELSEGRAFSADTPWQVELEDSFPYEETNDQIEAIIETKNDMERAKPMDRLICGDVGYGKTEVALRAAFKSVMDGHQVAVLVPTTVLAQQHYKTFSERLRPYPVRVEVLSRFRTEKEQKEIVEALSEGKIDVIIGTHRLVQKDIKFKSLGLIIVDEEQRFGVVHKESLKQINPQVDVLSMTATPIPRTLHLSLAGIRDMSTIQTPPEERLPIKTYVSEFSDELIREAIRRELDRKGQTYFLHNRVHDIDYIAGRIRDLVPEATVAVAHGQMSEGRLESTMVQFDSYQMDVLVCTTIIESGLDIPNVNTLIVNRADAFGLAQLYQLRGRVGRSSRRAYAYLLVPPTKSLTETAEKRLRTMLAATQLGAGFHIAMKDLEIRGAGNILGANQSGHIHAVGFELYTRLLNDAVESLRAPQDSSEEPPKDSCPDHSLEALSEGTSTSVDIGIPANIPSEYVTNLPTRLDIYRRFASITTMADLNLLEDEIIDRFGPLPWQVRNLLYLSKLKLRSASAGVNRISREGEKIVLRLNNAVGGARQVLRRLLGTNVEVGNTQIRIDVSGVEDWEEMLANCVDELAVVTEDLVIQLAQSDVDASN